MQEVENMLLSETDYDLELQRSVSISNATAHVANIRFPNYYPEYSSKKVLTMDWLEGQHLDQFLKTNPSQQLRDQIGQALWDFYDYQIHTMKEVHADPHPGNFIMDDSGILGIIDFGCVKKIQRDFYDKYFVLIDGQLLDDPTTMLKVLHRLGFIYEDDTPEDERQLFEVFRTMVDLLGRPFRTETFDFGNDAYFQEIYAFGEASSKVKALKNAKKPRGSREGLYVNRTYFGLYSILNQLKANISTKSDWHKNTFVL
jgi:predicted unusual protein kinase regulating ubiquinone biosynthesis (AarF/ABC1/UbiB family)